MDRNFQTSVVIPTTAEKRRAESLLRAIESVTTVQPRPAIPILICNGSLYDPDLFQTLKSRPDIRFYYREEGNLPKARNYGRQMVDTEYFGYLDDDDEFLPDTLRLREAPLVENHEIDAVVSNGYRLECGEQSLFTESFDPVAADPATSLMNFNWLMSCGGLYRSDTVGTEFFDPSIKDLEWTYTALRLATTRRIRFIDDPTFIYCHTPDSLSRSETYLENLPTAIAQLIETDLPRDSRRKLRIKLSAAYHDLADLQCDRGALAESWRSHLRSIMNPTGLLRYGLYTRRLLYRLFVSQ